MAQLRTAKLSKLDLKRKKDEQQKKIVNIKYFYREAVRKLSSTLKEPQGSSRRSCQGADCTGCFISLCQKEVIFTDSWTQSFLF